MMLIYDPNKDFDKAKFWWVLIRGDLPHDVDDCSKLAFDRFVAYWKILLQNTKRT